MHGAEGPAEAQPGNGAIVPIPRALTFISASSQGISSDLPWDILGTAACDLDLGGSSLGCQTILRIAAFSRRASVFHRADAVAIHAKVSPFDHDTSAIRA